MGDFPRIHPMPQSGADVPDDLDARLVVLGIGHPYSREANSPAELAAKNILEQRGNTPRLYRNTLVFLAADKTRLQDLDEAARKYLAWVSILAEQRDLNLSPFQVTQAETQRTAADSTVTARLPETYQWLLVPGQATPQAPITWEALRLSGTDALAVRASKKLRSDELYLTSFAATRLKMELDRVPLWQGNHVSIRQLVAYFASYLYLPRLKEPGVLLGALSAGLNLLTWVQDSFGLADSYDEAASRYRGLRGGTLLNLTDPQGTELVVRPEVASRQLAAERAAVVAQLPGGVRVNAVGDGTGGGGTDPAPPAVLPPTEVTPPVADSAEAVSWHRASGRGPRGSGCQQDRRGGHRPSRGPGGGQGHRDPRNRGGCARRGTRQGGADPDRELPDPEVHQSWVRARLGAIRRPRCSHSHKCAARSLSDRRQAGPGPLAYPSLPGGLARPRRACSWPAQPAGYNLYLYKNQRYIPKVALARTPQE
jgi:hypothetical protein